MKETIMLSKLKNLLIYFFFQGVENKVDLGTPDVYYAHNGVGGWIELKQKATKPKNKWTVPFRTGQYSWYKRYKHHAAPYFLVVTLGRDWYVIPMSKVKEEYQMYEMKEFFVCNDKEMWSSEHLFVAAFQRR